MKLRNQNLFFESAFINGEFFNKNETLEVINPSTGKIVGQIPNCTKSDIKTAINCAQNAFEKWSKLTGKERAKFLMNWHDLIIKNHEDLAIILTTEQGKPLAEARGEISYAANFVAWFSEEAKRIRGDAILAPKANENSMA